MRINDLKNHPLALNWAVATALGIRVHIESVEEQKVGWTNHEIILLNIKPRLKVWSEDGIHLKSIPDYCTDPAAAWPIIEQKLGVLDRRQDYFYCVMFTSKLGLGRTEPIWAYGPTILIAAMVCFVAAWSYRNTYNNGEIEVPPELLEAP